MKDKSNLVLLFLCAVQIAIIAGVVFWAATIREDSDAANAEAQPTPVAQFDLYPGN